MNGLLSTLVTGAAAKKLKAVEARPDRSHQHELNGVQALRALFGEERATRPACFVYLSEDELDVTRASGFVTWYDAREGHVTRSEFRLYFPCTEASERLQEGDLAVVLRRPDNSVVVAFAQAGSTAEHQLLWLFSLPSPTAGVEVNDVQLNDTSVGFAAREVLSQLGIEPAIRASAEESFLEVLLDRFGGSFPTTAEFSRFARGVTTDVDPISDPDGALMAWLEREEALFRQLERHLVLGRLQQGFGEDVDAFVAFSLSVQNRRKARIGYALENHIQAILEANAISFTRAGLTERNSRPDFVFPSVEAYRDGREPVERLAVLAVKSTCKDRWRQILTEADRIPVKHLLTLEPGISVSQTDEMTLRNVVLVVPLEIQSTFSMPQREKIVSLFTFLNILKTQLA